MSDHLPNHRHSDAIFKDTARDGDSTYASSSKAKMSEVSVPFTSAELADLAHVAGKLDGSIWRVVGQSVVGASLPAKYENIEAAKEFQRCKFEREGVCAKEDLHIHAEQQGEYTQLHFRVDAASVAKFAAANKGPDDVGPMGLVNRKNLEVYQELHKDVPRWAKKVVEHHDHKSEKPRGGVQLPEKLWVTSRPMSKEERASLDASNQQFLR